MSFKSKIITTIIIVFSMQLTPALAQGYKCTAQGLSSLLGVDLTNLQQKKLDVNFARSAGGADIYAYYLGKNLSVITASFKGNGGKADMNFYFQDKQNYLMEYHTVQNSNYYQEDDSVILTDEKSFYHVCDETLLAPAFGGIIDDDIYQNMKLVLDVILTEEAAQ